MAKEIGRVTIELSNRCNMAPFHKKCPLYPEKTLETLSTDKVIEILKYLGKIKYSKYVAFHNYSDPLQDPRLLYLIKKTKKHAPKAKVFILTNGWFLDQNILNDLNKLGVSKVRVSAYNDSDYKRLGKLKSKKTYRVKRIKEFDYRLDYYVSEEKPLKEPCYAPLGEVVIRCNGNVVLCCKDWKDTIVFGNVYKKPLKKILQNPKMKAIYKRLSKGDRYLQICRYCRTKGRFG